MKKEEKMAYIAGIMDGDGSFSLIKKKDCNSMIYYPLIQFSKSTPIFSDLLFETFGGNVSHSNRTANTHRTKSEYKWKLEKSTKCHSFLKEMVKYLQNKSEQCKNLIAYIETFPFKRGQRISDDQLIAKEKIRQNVLTLNSQRDISSRILAKASNSLKSELFWPYFAGLLDADGSFSIKREQRGSYSPNILLSSVNVKCINFIKSNCKNGSFCLVKAPQLKQKFYYRFGVYNKYDCIEVLNKIIPYLRFKKNAAEILLYFCENYVTQHGRYLKTKEQTEFREDCYRRIIIANDGVYKPSLIVLKTLTDDAEGNKAEAGDEPGTVNAVSEKAPLCGDAEL